MPIGHGSNDYGSNDPGAEQPIVRTTTQAREGVTGHNVRYVLLFGLVGVIIAFAVAWLFVAT